MKNINRLMAMTFLLLALLCGLYTNSLAQIPHLLNYQGRLTDKDNKPLEGAYVITFRIYDSQTAGSLLWEETHPSLLIQKGIFAVLLGSVTNLDLSFDKPYFLEIKVGSEVMAPRQQITSSAYAIRAETVESLPRGIITMWSGTLADIPSGWALCDGTNGTPDLRDKFIVGAGNNYSVAATGGEAHHSLTIDEIPSHNHTWASESQGSAGGSGTSGFAYRNSGGSTGYTGGGKPHNNLPPYYAAAYIMKL